jgi:hypothetical protein
VVYCLPLLMHLLAENYDALRLATSSQTLLNSNIEGLAIRHESDGLVAEVVFRLQHSTRVNRLLLLFKPVTAYAFDYRQRLPFITSHPSSFCR